MALSNIAVYPGSFDPFTNGHLDMVKKASKLFDKVYVVIGVNFNKKRSYDSGLMKEAIEKTLEENSITEVEEITFDNPWDAFFDCLRAR